MMYQMKKIVVHDAEILLPKCMYRIKNPNEISKVDDIDIDISKQVMKFLKRPANKMAELAQRQELLLKKLDVLYDKIKTISSLCSNVNVSSNNRAKTTKQAISIPDEIVVIVSPDNLPWFLNIILKETAVNVSWHIHSSIPNEKVAKIKSFGQKLKISNNNSKINLRLIFKCVSADAELRLSSLTVPIVGMVNILRYLSLVYPNVLPSIQDDYNIDTLLDLCHVLERSTEKNRQQTLEKLFSQNQNWIYNNQFTIVDVAVFNVIKQWQNGAKYVPKHWYAQLEQMCT